MSFSMMHTTSTVNDLMTGRPIWVPEAAHARDALVLAETEGVHYLLVADRDKDLAGVTCLCDVSRAGLEDRVKSFAHNPVTYVMSGESAENAVNMMSRCAVGCLPVLEDPGRVIGILTRHDLVQAGLIDRKSTRLNSSHVKISYAVFCWKKKNNSWQDPPIGLMIIPIALAAATLVA